jgi:hypothetical protein
MHAMQEAKIIDMLVDMGKEIRAPFANPTLWRKLPGRSKNPLGSGQRPGVGQGARVAKILRLAVMLGQQWFVIERIDLTDSSLHEKKYHPLGSRRQVKPLASRQGRIDQ